MSNLFDSTWLKWGYETALPDTVTFPDGTVNALVRCKKDRVPKLTSPDYWPRKPTKFQCAFAYCFDYPPTVGRVFYAVNTARTFMYFSWAVGKEGSYRTLLLSTARGINLFKHGLLCEPYLDIKKFFSTGRMLAVVDTSEFGPIPLNIGPSALLMWFNEHRLPPYTRCQQSTFGPAAHTLTTMKAIVKFHAVVTRQRALKPPHGRGYKRSIEELFPNGELTYADM